MAFGSSSQLQAAACLAVLALLVVAPGLAFGAPGDLDPAFSLDGKTVLQDAGNGYPEVAVQADGRIVMAGPPGFLLRRVLANGAPDRSFGNDGEVTTGFGGTASASATALQPDGRIVVAGRASGALALARYLPDGTLDDSFSGDGRVVTGQDGYVDGLAVQPDGRIVAAGWAGGGGFALARFNSDGSPDDSFSGDGRLVLQVGDGASGLALAPDGGIVVAGTSFADAPFPGGAVAVARLTPNGTLDPSFAGDGVSTTQYSAFGDLANDVVVQPDGSVVTAGIGWVRAGEYDYRGKFELARLTPDGELDSTFSGGTARTGFGTGFASDAYARALALQPDGKLVAAGEAGRDFALARYNGDGTPDDTFSGDGKLVTSFSNPPEEYRNTLGATDVALAPDGKIVAGGSRNFRREWMISRYEVAAGPGDADADGVLDARDSCPPRFGRHDGCPRFRRALEIRFSPKYDEFRGELRGGGFECDARQRVALFERHPGHDKLVGADTPRPSGYWEVPFFRPRGRFYARVKRHVRPSYGICGRARSTVLDLGRP